MFCMKFGKEIPEGNEFCLYCGAKARRAEGRASGNGPVVEADGMPQHTVKVQSPWEVPLAQKVQRSSRLPIILLSVVATLAYDT